MLRHADRPHSRPTAAVRDAKSLVQVQVADVRAHVAWPAESHLRIHVCAVHIDLAAVTVNQPADFLDRLFEDAVRAGIGDHQRGQTVAMPFDFHFQVCHVDIAVLITAYDHYFHARHHRAGRVGAVGGGGDQADVALFVTTAAVQSANSQQPGILALGTGIGLEGDGGEACDLLQG